MKLPKHISLYIEHNDYQTHYETCEDYLLELERDGRRIDPNDKEEILATGELWTIQWYPETPIGFYFVVAATLERALEIANSLK